MVAYGPRRSGVARLAAVVAGLAAGAVALPMTATAAQAAPGDTTGTRHEVTYFYGSGPRNMFDAYWHNSREARPGIVIFHGGYWVGGDKGTWKRTARWYADRGFAVFSVNYRLAQDAPWPAQRTDALNAIDYLKKHAAQFDLDPDRMAVLGSSAGGQIAADAGTYESARDRVRGVVALSPVLAPYQAYLDGAAAGASKHRRKLRRTAAELAACEPGPARSCWGSWYKLTPKNNVSADDVPMLIAFSRDDLVSPTEGIGLRDALRSHGLGGTLTVRPGGYHGGALLKLPGMHHQLLKFFQRVTRDTTPAKKAVISSTSSPKPSAKPSPTDSPKPTGKPKPTLPTEVPTPTLPKPSVSIPSPH